MSSELALITCASGAERATLARAEAASPLERRPRVRVVADQHRPGCPQFRHPPVDHLVAGRLPRGQRSEVDGGRPRGQHRDLLGRPLEIRGPRDGELITGLPAGQLDQRDGARLGPPDDVVGLDAGPLQVPVEHGPERVARHPPEKRRPVPQPGQPDRNVHRPAPLMGDASRPVPGIDQIDNSFPDNGKGRWLRLLHSAEYCGNAPLVRTCRPPCWPRNLSRGLPLPRREPCPPALAAHTLILDVLAIRVT